MNSWTNKIVNCCGANKGICLLLLNGSKFELNGWMFEYAAGIDFGNYGSDRWQSNFWKRMIYQCKFFLKLRVIINSDKSMKSMPSTNNLLLPVTLRIQRNEYKPMELSCRRHNHHRHHHRFWHLYFPKSLNLAIHELDDLSSRMP